METGVQRSIQQLSSKVLEAHNYLVDRLLREHKIRFHSIRAAEQGVRLVRSYTPAFSPLLAGQAGTGSIQTQLDDSNLQARIQISGISAQLCIGLVSQANRWLADRELVQDVEATHRTII